MKIDNMSPYRTAVMGMALINLSQMAAGQDNLSNSYCSSENTGSDSSPSYSIYQSMGLCSGTCSGYAFAILQGKNCWCSDYVPMQQDSTSNCGVKCPGFPTDLCGNPGQNLFGYVALGKPPSGTAGASSSQPQSTPPVQSSSPPQYTSSTPSSSAPPPPPPSSSAPPSSTSFSSSSPSPTSSSSSSSPSTSSSTSHDGTPVVHTRIITRSGSVVTTTVTTTPMVMGGDSPVNAQLERKGLSGGAIAGIVIGTLIGLAALALAAFLLWRRKKNTDAEGQPGLTRPKRTTSVLSRTGLLSRGRPVSMAENTYDQDASNNGGNSVRHSMMLGAGASIEPSSPLGGSQDNLSSRRHSRPLVYDQRLNPSALFANAEANGSRVSMQDQQDYSRPLGIANPDYRASFDSR